MLKYVTDKKNQKHKRLKIYFKKLQRCNNKKCSKVILNTKMTGNNIVFASPKPGKGDGNQFCLNVKSFDTMILI